MRIYGAFIASQGRAMIEMHSDKKRRERQSFRDVFLEAGIPLPATINKESLHVHARR